MQTSVATTNTPKPIERIPLEVLLVGVRSDFFAILTQRSRNTTRAGKPYYRVMFRAAHRVVPAVIWQDSLTFEAFDTKFAVGEHFKIRGRLVDDRFGLQLEIENIRQVVESDVRDGYDPAALLPGPTFDVEALWRELLSHAESIVDDGLRQLAVTILSENEAALKEHPAAIRNHHAYRGGFLEHVVSVVRNGEFFVQKYHDAYPDLKPPLNRDLVIAGCLLHDIGKLEELDTLPAADSAVYSVPGHLLGHILLGRDLVRATAQRLGTVDPELLLYLDHIIVAHHGTAEFGSPREPMIPEAYLVHMADDLDAKMAMFATILTAESNGSPVSEASNPLRRRILKHRTV